MKIINNQPNIKIGQFTQEKFDVVLTKIQNRKADSLDIIVLIFLIKIFPSLDFDRKSQ